MLLSVPHVILQKILSSLVLEDISIIVTLSRYTKSIKRQIYESALYAKICNQCKINTMVQNCPKIKHLVISAEKITCENFELLHQLNLETLLIESDIDGKLSFRNLKRLDVINLDEYDIDDCVSLEHIGAKTFTNYINRKDFPNLKSVRLGKGIYYQSDLPITDLWVSSTIASNIFELPLHTLYINNLQSPDADRVFSLIEKSKIKKLYVGSRTAFSASCNSSELTSLGLNRCILKDLNTPNIRRLTLAHITVDLQLLIKMQYINELHLEDCKYDYSQFGLLAELPITKLRIINCQVDLGTIAKMRLKDLVLTGCHVTGDFNELPKTLNTLSLIDLNINEIPYLDKLHTLTISNTSEDDREVISERVLHIISRLPLINLTLNGCMLNDSHINYFADMQLNSLDIKNNNITIVGIRKLKRLPLRRLEVSNIPLLHMILCAY